MKHDLILLGQGPSMDNCPFDTETWAALSVLSHKGFEDKPYSKLFCFDLPSTKADEQAGLEVALTRDIPIVSTKAWSFVTESFPLFAIRDRFQSLYFRNDMTYMIALALYKGYKSLLLWGVDGGPELVYTLSRKHVTYWLGVATGMGVEWKLAPNSILWREGE